MKIKALLVGALALSVMLLGLRFLFAGPGDGDRGSGITDAAAGVEGTTEGRDRCRRAPSS